MIHSTRFKLIFSFLCVSFLAGGIALFIGARLLYDAVVREATNQTRLALHAAEDAYHTRVRFVDLALHITTLGMGFRISVTERNIPDLVDRLKRMAKNADLDFCGIALEDGRVLCRAGLPTDSGDAPPPDNPAVRYVVNQGDAVAGTIVINRRFLEMEAPRRAGDVNFYPFQTDGEEKDRESCLAIAAAVPVFEFRTAGKLLAVLYGGRVVNQSADIFDSARPSAVFDEIQPEAAMPVTSIFLDTFRIATNRLDPQGNRAVGTRVNGLVREQVLARGKPWTQRLEDLGEDYISAFTPLYDIFGKRIGMLSVASLEANYAGIQRKLIVMFIAATGLGVLCAIGLGCFLSGRVMDPVHRLITASREVSKGNLAPEIGPISKDDEIAMLQTTFKDMVASVNRMSMASQSKIIQSEKQASVGRLAAGVAHEINNPLTGVLTYTHMLLRRKDIGDDIRADLQVIVESTERVRKIVKGLLDFSRQTRLDPEATEINRLIDATIKLVENQALLKGVSLTFHAGDPLPMIVLDRSQIQSVLLNMILNALDATEPSGEIRVATSAALSADDLGRRGIEITIADNGSGMPPEYLSQIFDPFFTTKDVGKGTGLGLSVSLGIVKEHGGAIRVQSEPGKGTTFFVWLPMERQVEQDESTDRGR